MTVNIEEFEIILKKQQENDMMLLLKFSKIMNVGNENLGISSPQPSAKSLV